MQANVAKEDEAQPPSCRFTAAIVLCDALWADPDKDSSNGIDVRVQLDFLRLDSMIMMVQLNIREIISVRHLVEPLSTQL